MIAADREFIQSLPKAELHVHIEGTLEPELMFRLAERNGIIPGSDQFPFRTVAAVREAYQFSNLQDFLDIYYQGANVLRTEEDFYDLASAYFDRAAADGVRHAEIFFDPQTHTGRGVDYKTIIDGFNRAAEDAEKRHDLTVSYIHSFLRHLSEEEALESLEMARPHLADPANRIIGVGLDSSELGYPPEKFVRVFAKASSLGLMLMAHAGEEGPPAYVWQALDVLNVGRIDHGNRSLEDLALVARLAGDQMTLTVCPLSNFKLCNVTDLAAHPIRQMLDAGLKATINSDDPAYFGGYIVDNFTALTERGVIDAHDCVTLARNSIKGAFMHPERRQDLLTELNGIMPQTPRRQRKPSAQGPEL